ncbi:CdaR family protein [Lactococcus termiticola]|uniref:Cell surface protein n=1 Tax=Lactococcus termiticola TaxID=2169526 RepID=A0A2R5HIB2_9LACT|nr:CdaR family protein [Lactococcus termiticola]GBG96028.1 hypothetical protein NtB2_00131 [Lactococcus termiticola]
MKFPNFFSSKAFYILTAVFFAVILFFNANSVALRNQGNSIQAGEVYTATVSNVPIEVKYDNNKYFVSGYQATANVALSGYNRLQISNEQNADTRNFSLVVDLTHNEAGTVQAPIKVEGLPSGINAQLTPNTLSINIEPKVTKEFKVTAPVAANQLSPGYSVASTELSQETVKVSAGENTLEQIQSVEAVLPTNTVLSSDFSDTVSLRALDASGKSVSAQIQPNHVKLNLKLNEPSKTVPIEVKQTGSLASSVKSMALELQTKSIKISGAQADLDKITSITVSVDVSGITETVTRHVHVTVPDGITADPVNVDVNVNPTKN